MRRSNHSFGWLSIAGFALVYVGCDSSKPVAPTARTGQSAESGASAPDDSPVAAKSAVSADDAPSKNSAAKKTAAGNEAAPRTNATATAPASLEEATRIIDFRKFPMLPAGNVIHKLPAKVGYELLSADTAQASQFYRKKLAEAGWSLEPETADEQSGLRMFNGSKQDFSVSVTAVKNPNSGKAQVFVENQGNVDARTLPRFPGAKLDSAHFQSVSYRADARLEDVAEFIRTELKKQGWRDVIYAAKDPLKQPGLKDRVVGRQRGHEINAILKVEEGQTTVNCNVHLAQNELPIMPEATGAIEFLDTPLRLFYGVPTTPDRVLAYYRQELPKLGWTIVPGTDSIEDGQAKITLEAAEQQPLRLELLEDEQGHTTILISRPT